MADQLYGGDRICSTFTEHDERNDLVAELVGGDLTCGQKVMCYADATTCEDLIVVLALRKSARMALSRGQAVIRSCPTNWLSGLRPTSAYLRRRHPRQGGGHRDHQSRFTSPPGI